VEQKYMLTHTNHMARHHWIERPYELHTYSHQIVHLHFEIWKEGQAVDPLSYFPELNKTNMSVD